MCAMYIYIYHRVCYKSMCANMNVRKILLNLNYQEAQCYIHTIIRSTPETPSFSVKKDVLNGAGPPQSVFSAFSTMDSSCCLEERLLDYMCCGLLTRMHLTEGSIKIA